MQIEKMKAPSEFEELSTRLAALGNPTRLRLLSLLLAVDEPLCVCELSSSLGIPDYQTSRHLKALSVAGWVSGVRKGLWIYYELGEEPLLVDLRQTLIPVSDDLDRLRQRLCQREGGRCVVGPSHGREQ